MSGLSSLARMKWRHCLKASIHRQVPTRFAFNIEMPKTCIMPGCSTKFVRESGIALHLFPKDELRRLRWIKAIETISKTKLVIQKSSCVCSLHFRDEFYEENDIRKKLKSFAIPSVSYKSVNGQTVMSTLNEEQFEINFDEEINDEINSGRTEVEVQHKVQSRVKEARCFDPVYDESFLESEGSDNSSSFELPESPKEIEQPDLILEPIIKQLDSGSDRARNIDTAIFDHELSKPTKMLASNWTDSDGFKLQFEPNCSDKDKTYFVTQYPKVDAVIEKRLHCTTCDIHIGSAPIAEKIVRTHEVLEVTQCNKCHAFYNSGEFGTGEDGSEFYCRWCGQGGEVLCCTRCPYVFCSKCIKLNLSSSYVKEIQKTDDWLCFVCNKDMLREERAQHWALRNFMNKQLEKIQKITVNSGDELNQMLNEDQSECCPRKKRKLIAKPVPTPVKRPMNGYTAAQPPAKKSAPNPSPPQMVLKAVKVGNNTKYKMVPSTSVSKKPGQKSNSEIVCTPDITGLFNENDDSTIPTTNMMPSTSLAPPPLIMRNQQRMVRPANPVNPIYHNVNGFQIDLNHAARQEIFRLPNGKLIQVRKQSNPPPTTILRPGIINPIMQPRGAPQFTIRQTVPMSNPSARSYRPRLRTAFPQQRFAFNDGRIVANPQTQPVATPPIPSSTQSASTVFTQQNGSISVARAPQPSTPFGASKTAFEDKIINGLEICQHTINKMITLTNSSSFKNSHSFCDLKELYIHLQYLFTYTSGKFTTLQESLKTGMEELAKHDAQLKEACDADELEIVEEKHDVIEVLSDDEEEVAAAIASIVTPNCEASEQNDLDSQADSNVTEETETKTRGKPGPASAKKSLIKHIQYTTQDKLKAIETEKETEANAATGDILRAMFSEYASDSSDSASVKMPVKVDKKLKNKVVVKVERLEDSKNPIIKQFMIKLKEKMSKEEPSDIPNCEAVLEEESREALTIEEMLQCTVDIDTENPEMLGITIEGTADESSDDGSTQVVADKALPKDVPEDTQDDAALDSPDDTALATKNDAALDSPVDTALDVADEDANLKTDETDVASLSPDVADKIAEEVEDVVQTVINSIEAGLLKIDNAPPVELMEVSGTVITKNDEEEEENSDEKLDGNSEEDPEEKLSNECEKTEEFENSEKSDIENLKDKEDEADEIEFEEEALKAETLVEPSVNGFTETCELPAKDEIETIVEKEVNGIEKDKVEAENPTIESNFSIEEQVARLNQDPFDEIKDLPKNHGTDGSVETLPEKDVVNEVIDLPEQSLMEID